MGKINIDSFCIDDVFDKMNRFINEVSLKDKKKKEKKHHKKEEKDGKLVIEINV